MRENRMEKIGQLARDWRRAGHTIFVYDIQLSTMRLSGGRLDPIAYVLEAIEETGWKLDQATMANTRWIGIFRWVGP